MGRILYILMVTGLAAAQAGQLGSTSSSETLPGINQFTQHTNSCILTHLQLAEYLSQEGQPISSVPPVPLTFKYEAQRVQATLYPSLEGEWPLVYLPKQNFLVRNIETLHKSVHSRVEFDGFYVLMKVPDEKDPSFAFLSSKFVVLRPKNRFPALPSTDYFLIPLHQLKTLRTVLENGKNSSWEFDGPTISTTYSPPPLSPRPGLVRTGRGTYYRFNENGSVDIYPRHGEVKHIPPPSPARGEPAYASHAAILARQGVRVGEMDSATLTEHGISRNAEAIRKYQDEARVPTAARGIHAYQLEQSLEAFRKGERSAVGTAIRLSEDHPEYLPEYLRWKKMGDKSLLTAPTNAQGEKIFRVIHPFICVRDPKEQSIWKAMEFRIISPDAIHLQALHAAIGELAIHIEKEGWVVGGHVTYEYSATDGQLIGVRFESNGMISLNYDRGKPLKLENSEIQRLKSEIEQSLPWNRRKEIPLENFE